MEFKFLIMMTRLQNITVATLLAGNSNVLRPGHHYQNLNSINSRRPWLPILISHLFQHSLFLDSWPQLFLHQGCFGWDFTTCIATVCLHMIVNDCIHKMINLKKPLACT